MKLTLKHGRIYAGIKLPFLASTAVVAAHLRQRGLHDVLVIPKDTAVKRYNGTLPVTPPTKAWDTWIEVTYSPEVDLDDTVQWVIQPDHERVTRPAIEETPASLAEWERLCHCGSATKPHVRNGYIDCEHWNHHCESCHETRACTLTACGFAVIQPESKP